MWQGSCGTVACLQDTSLCGKVHFRENFIKKIPEDGLGEEGSGFTSCVLCQLLSLLSREEEGERCF